MFLSKIPYRYIKKIRYIKNLLFYANINPRRFVVFDDRKCAFLSIPKNSSSSIQVTIGKSYGIFTKMKSIEIYLMFNQKVQRHHLKNAKTYFKFAFVRNPYARVVSCYKDKVIQVPDYFYGYFVNLKNNNFAEFVKNITRIPDFLADKHFKSQYSILYQRGNLLVDYVGKVETITQDWNKVANRCGFESSLSWENKTGATERDYRSFYTEELANLIYQRYQNDFELLGYQTARQELLNFIKEHN